MSQQGQAAQVHQIVEERFFPIALDRNYELLVAAIRDALGPVEEIAYGMWSAQVEPTFWSEMEVVVRATEAEGGTTIVVSIQPQATGKGIVLGTMLALPAVMLVVPLLVWIPWAMSRQRHNSRRRLVTMHRTWTEIGRAVGAPKRAGYRGPPTRARVHDESAEPDEDEVEVDEPQAREKQAT